MPKLTTAQGNLEQLRQRFMYDCKGKPLLEEYGAFKIGITNEEVEDYLRVRTNSHNIKQVKEKLYRELRGNTSPLAIVNGQAVCLAYRHDIQRQVDFVLDGKPTYFD